MDTKLRHAIDNWPHNWPDWAHLLLGLWMFAAPFVLGFGTQVAAPGSSILFGLVIALLAAFELLEPEAFEEGINMVLGFSLAVSPWFFSYTADQALTVNALLGGLAVLLLAVWSMLRKMPGDHWWHHTHHS